MTKQDESMMPATTTAAPPRNLHHYRALLGQHFGLVSILVVFVVLFLFFSVQTESFLTANNLVNVARQIAPTVIVAMAMTFVITTGQIDLSVGSLVGLSAASLAIMAASGNPVLALI